MNSHNVLGQKLQLYFILECAQTNISRVGRRVLMCAGYFPKQQLPTGYYGQVTRDAVATWQVSADWAAWHGHSRCFNHRVYSCAGCACVRGSYREKDKDRMNWKPLVLDFGGHGWDFSVSLSLSFQVVRIVGKVLITSVERKIVQLAGRLQRRTADLQWGSSSN